MATSQRCCKLSIWREISLPSPVPWNLRKTESWYFFLFSAAFLCLKLSGFNANLQSGSLSHHLHPPTISHHLPGVMTPPSPGSVWTRIQLTDRHSCRNLDRQRASGPGRQTASQKSVSLWISTVWGRPRTTQARQVLVIPHWPQKFFLCVCESRRQGHLQPRLCKQPQSA